MNGCIGIAPDIFFSTHIFLEFMMKVDLILQLGFLGLGAFFAGFASFTDYSDLNVDWATLCVALAIYWKE